MTLKTKNVKLDLKAYNFKLNLGGDVECREIANPTNWEVVPIRDVVTLLEAMRFELAKVTEVINVEFKQ